jgi:hypothetical protein
MEPERLMPWDLLDPSKAPPADSPWVPWYVFWWVLVGMVIAWSLRTWVRRLDPTPRLRELAARDMETRKALAGLTEPELREVLDLCWSLRSLGPRPRAACKLLWGLSVEAAQKLVESEMGRRHGKPSVWEVMGD